MTQIEDIVLSVPDVSCEHCVKAVNGALGSLVGVETVSTDIPTKSVYVRYDLGQLSLAQIEAALDDVGYTVAKEPPSTPRASGKPLDLL
ncbi:MAG: heavy-metal-associated domain-containing protein [Ktedonobacteraceae bacterium]